MALPRIPKAGSGTGMPKVSGSPRPYKPRVASKPRMPSIKRMGASRPKSMGMGTGMGSMMPRMPKV